VGRGGGREGKRCGLIRRMSCVPLLLLSGVAAAGEQRATPFDWSGLYLGGHVGYSRGNDDATYFIPGAQPANHNFGTIIGGAHAGYNVVLPSRILIGIEADATFPNFLETDDILVRRPTPQGIVEEKFGFVSTVRGRVGLVRNDWLLYATAGYAWSQARFIETPGVIKDEDKVLRLRSGFAAGGGVERALTPEWSARAEYLYTSFAKAGADLPSGTRIESTTDLHQLRVGLTYHFGHSASGTPLHTSMASPLGYDQWNVHGQMTVIGQGYQSFRSPYQGQQSLSGFSQFKNTGTATAYVGVRLWEGGEAYVNPELMQGFGLSDVTGVAGFPNGEAQKSNFPVPRLNISRVFLRHTFGFGGGQETFEDGANQLAGKQDISRLTITAGKFSVTDYFDNNAYAHDPRTNFMNWTMMCCAAYDWVMDKLAWTWGAMADFNQKDWAYRAGYFLLPEHSNSNFFEKRFPERGHFVNEIELRYGLAGQSGKLRLLGWVQQGNSGSYAEALAQPATTANYPDITLTRRTRSNYGVTANLEHTITSDLGVFARAGWNPGQVEMMGWTDVHRSYSAGASLRGTAWQRPDDKIGVGGVINALSSVGQRYFAAGGLGILIGDGALNYREEKILETYYSYALSRWSWVTFDYQYVANPGYNADRGPVSIYAGRLHMEF